MIKTIFLILIIALVVTLYGSLLVVIIIDLKEHLREEIYRRDELKESILNVIKWSGELEKYIPSDNLSEDDEECIEVLQKAIKKQLHSIDKLFKRGF